ncbi:MAG TPA: hypothetical protein VGW75_16085 [Solirubrobacteraceae bacterium]|nr:hypothetical protein [Solirubrobacteraceae bacterium]
MRAATTPEQRRAACRVADHARDAVEVPRLLDEPDHFVEDGVARVRVDDRLQAASVLHSEFEFDGAAAPLPVDHEVGPAGVVAAMTDFDAPATTVRVIRLAALALGPQPKAVVAGGALDLGGKACDGELVADLSVRPRRLAPGQLDCCGAARRQPQHASVEHAFAAVGEQAGVQEACDARVDPSFGDAEAQAELGGCDETEPADPAQHVAVPYGLAPPAAPAHDDFRSGLIVGRRGGRLRLAGQHHRLALLIRLPPSVPLLRPCRTSLVPLAPPVTFLWGLHRDRPPTLTRELRSTVGAGGRARPTPSHPAFIGASGTPARAVVGRGHRQLGGRRIAVRHVSRQVLRPSHGSLTRRRA